MEILWILSFFFAFCLMAFIAIALLFPEWVGITGKKAKDIQEHQSHDHESSKEPSSEKHSSENQNK